MKCSRALERTRCRFRTRISANPCSGSSYRYDYDVAKFLLAPNSRLFSTLSSSSSSFSISPLFFTNSSFSHNHSTRRTFAAAAAGKPAEKKTLEVAVYENLPPAAIWDEAEYLKLKAEAQAEAMREWEWRQIREPNVYVLPPNGSKDILSRRTKILIKEITNLTLFELMQLEREMRGCIQLDAKNKYQYYQLQAEMAKKLAADPKYADLFKAQSSPKTKSLKIQNVQNGLSGKVLKRQKFLEKVQSKVAERLKEEEAIQRIEALQTAYLQKMKK